MIQAGTACTVYAFSRTVQSGIDSTQLKVELRLYSEYSLLITYLMIVKERSKFTVAGIRLGIRKLHAKLGSKPVKLYSSIA